MNDLMLILAAIAAAAPALLLAALGSASILGWKLSEAAVGWLTRSLVGMALLAALGIGLVLTFGQPRLVLDLGEWVSVHAHADHPGYHFRLKLVFDGLSVPFLILSLALCAVVGAFATRYMHREPGFHRFFVLYAAFAAGITVAATAGTIETLFVGWELVGLSSAFLVGFFQERPSPVRNGLRVWVVYRIADAALLVAAVLTHRIVGSGELDLTRVSPGDAFILGSLLLVAAAGKSALLPFSGWLPRAMEGPTPSSAVFYGALSVHLGAYLLLRCGPLLDASPPLAAITVALGLMTAAYAWWVGQVQTDIKSALAFASLTQVGIIIAEIGIGWRLIPLIHILSHACLRTLQFIRAPTLLQDYRHLENAIGGRLPQRFGPDWLLPRALQPRLYRFALERGRLDETVQRFLVTPFLEIFRALDGWDRRMSRRLENEPGVKE